ncbi:hypothetical protein R1A27_29620 [Methylobacterium sp. NMS12]|uniref:hypothetical protein n=1 Tax=Methylobacterium sp. NMS12 TaxID=3079766 RepID=UPI003F88355E
MNFKIEDTDVTFWQAEASEEEEIIYLVKEYMIEGEIDIDIDNFANFLKERLRGLSGRFIIYTPGAENHVALYTQIYTVYTASSLRERRKFLGFCSIQQRLQLGIYPVCEYKLPYDMEIPWFFTVRDARFPREKIARFMMEQLLEQIPNNQVNFVWAYSTSFDPPAAWWLKCLEDAGFKPIKASLTHRAFGSHLDGDCASLINSHRLKIDGEKENTETDW